MMSVKQAITTLLLIGFCSVLTHCASPRFERAWDESVSQPKSYSSPTGPWTGKWNTKTNGHEGGLRCIVSEVENKSGKLQFWYHATWGPGFSAPFKVKYDAVKTGSNHFEIKGSENLGVFGSFQHDAVISKSSFKAKYSNKKHDVGSFKLHRPGSN